VNQHVRTCHCRLTGNAALSRAAPNAVMWWLCRALGWGVYRFFRGCGKTFIDDDEAKSANTEGIWQAKLLAVMQSEEES
jgi:hypothetical protein